jgi:hypothetical protein
MDPNNNEKFKTRKELANELGVCNKTLKKMLREKDIVIKRGLISPKDQELIYTILGFCQGQKIP